MLTDAQYEPFAAETGREPPRHWSRAAPAGGIADHPVIFVSWFGERAFAEGIGGGFPSEKSVKGQPGGLTEDDSGGASGTRVAVALWKRGSEPHPGRSVLTGR